MDQSQFNEALCDFISRATTPFHAVQAMAETLVEAGFQKLEVGTGWSLAAGGKYFVVRNHGAIAAFNIGTSGKPCQGMRMVGAHTDSPCLMVKPNPEIRRKGYLQLGVQVYGGALLNPWFDRDLSLAGRVSFERSDGTLGSAIIDFRQALATIPSLAIHLDREANKNRTVNPQKDIVPLIAMLSEGEGTDFRALLLGRLLDEHDDCGAVRVLDFEMSFYDTQRPALVGINEDFIASARLDNLLSCYTGLQALLACDGTQSSLLVCNDHEEVGSSSVSGANGPFLRDILQRLEEDQNSYAALVENSLMISADNAHGIHPNFVDKHDENHGPMLNQGPVIKVNANQRYATSSETSGLFRLLAEKEQVPVQAFVVRSDMACGSTIGPITAAGTGIKTLDIGVPTFAMHSIRELAGSEDAYNLSRVLTRFFSHSGKVTAA
ncbi:MAG: M18 family aminopeptidase [Halioglobus sp.]